MTPDRLRQLADAEERVFFAARSEEPAFRCVALEDFEASNALREIGPDAARLLADMAEGLRGLLDETEPSAHRARVTENGPAGGRVCPWCDAHALLAGFAALGENTP